jgi:hypothetical protein
VEQRTDLRVGTAMMDFVVRLARDEDHESLLELPPSLPMAMISHSVAVRSECLVTVARKGGPSPLLDRPYRKPLRKRPRKTQRFRRGETTI